MTRCFRCSICFAGSRRFSDAVREHSELQVASYGLKRFDVAYPAR